MTETSQPDTLDEAAARKSPLGELPGATKLSF